MAENFEKKNTHHRCISFGHALFKLRFSLLWKQSQLETWRNCLSACKPSSSISPSLAPPPGWQAPWSSPTDAGTCHETMTRGGLHLGWWPDTKPPDGDPLTQRGQLQSNCSVWTSVSTTFFLFVCFLFFGVFFLFFLGLTPSGSTLGGCSFRLIF